MSCSILVRTVRGLADGVRGPFLGHAQRYVQVVTGREWAAMAHNHEAALEEGGRLLDRMWDLLVAYDACSGCHQTLHEQALARFNDLSDLRTSRLSSSRVRIPLALRLLLYAGAIITVGSMYLFAVERFAVHAFMTGALAGAISHVLYVINDLDDCFDGDWRVLPTPFERVGRYVSAALDECALPPTA